MRKIFFIGLCLIFLSGCQTTKQEEIKENNMQVINPLVEYSSLEECEQIVGFSLKIPKCDGEYTYRVINNEIIEVTIQEEIDTISIRKAIGSEDISGYYSDNVIVTYSVNDMEIVGKGDSCLNLIYSASWHSDKYTFAVYSKEGVTQSELTSLITKIE